MFFYLLALLFIALKLMGVIDWSWFWVVLPAFVPAVAVFVVVLRAAAGKHSQKGRQQG